MITQQRKNQTSDSLRWYSSSLLADLPHAMLCRHGGVSVPPFASLNLSFSVGDKPESVAENRELLKQHFQVRHLVSAVQVHGHHVFLAEDAREDIAYQSADALVTRQPGVALLIQQADCQAVLLHDPVRKAVAAVHSGWKGSVQNIIAATITTMRDQCGVHPTDIRAVISPSLGPCCAEFINWYQELPRSMHRYQIRKNYFDFWAISREQLVRAGVRDEHIETTGICTLCDRDFFSYRRAVKQTKGPESGITGRCGSFIMLPQYKLSAFTQPKNPFLLA